MLRAESMLSEQRGDREAIQGALVLPAMKGGATFRTVHRDLVENLGIRSGHHNCPARLCEPVNLRERVVYLFWQ